MITAFVQFQLPAPTTLKQAESLFAETAPIFIQVPGLIRKYFLLSEDGKIGGVYLWKNREHAEVFYSNDFRESIVEKLGSEPTITYFESPVIVDNIINQVIADS